MADVLCSGVTIVRSSEKGIRTICIRYEYCQDFCATYECMTERHLVPPSVRDVYAWKCCKMRTLLVGAAEISKSEVMDSRSSRSVPRRSTDMLYISVVGCSAIRSSTKRVFGDVPVG